MSGALEEIMAAKMDAENAPDVIVTPLTVPRRVTATEAVPPPRQDVYKDLGDEVFS